MNTIARLAGPLAIATLAAGLVATPADARSTDTIRTGGCSGSAVWKLKAKHDDGRIEVEYEVDSNRRGQVWRVVLWNEGRVVYTGRHTTVGRSGSFSVERRIADRPGTDDIRARARHLSSGQVCGGALSLS